MLVWRLAPRCREGHLPREAWTASSPSPGVHLGIVSTAPGWTSELLWEAGIYRAWPWWQARWLSLLFVENSHPFVIDSASPFYGKEKLYLACPFPGTVYPRPLCLKILQHSCALIKISGEDSGQILFLSPLLAPLLLLLRTRESRCPGD